MDSGVPTFRVREIGYELGQHGTIKIFFLCFTLRPVAVGPYVNFCGADLNTNRPQVRSHFSQKSTLE